MTAQPHHLDMGAPDMAALSEVELVGRARGGDAAAFRAIMQASNQRLFRTARSIVRDESEAEDVVQEAYAKAFQHLDGFRGEARILTWLTRIVVNEARGRLRKRRTMVDLSAIEQAQGEAGRVVMFPGALAAGDPEREAARAEMRRLLERALDGLPEPLRLVFILREIEDCSVAETAQALGVRAETVKTRLHRARRQLRRTLDAQLAAAVTEAFPFLGARCARITEAVVARLRAAGLAA
ncbi:RNA polymerase sigma-70 factor,ECF subfamily [Phenylobacterium zucineum HLK1]|uniref:RNA polymerase sigma factor n=1 Tax=Phenylobacterium zucineum (strain HLK1) TaxID=450851 RepID=B4RD59_PHEZH|nr:RNA polymerase sigma factor [Phenylobacterium zucineum]ACG76663.1 RNA polymerase sigma-70 factor,ECF subfamily [Phenylobacterium zucineum HLK1]